MRSGFGSGELIVGRSMNQVAQAYANSVAAHRFRDRETPRQSPRTLFAVHIWS